MKLQLGDLVQIDWNDACSSSSWFCKDEIKEKKSIKCVTIARLVEETEEEYKVTATIAADGDILGYTIIPKSMAVKVKKL